MRGKHLLPGTIDGMKHVCYFRHALALDERRVKFLPEYAYGGSATPPTRPEDKKVLPVNHKYTHNDISPSTRSEDDCIVAKGPSGNDPTADTEAIANRSQVGKESMATPPHTIEVWFAGTHSDMYAHSLFQYNEWFW